MMPAVNNEKKKERPNCDDDICASDDYPLIPGLPDHISKAFLAMLPRASFTRLQLVSRSWKRYFQSEELFDIRRQVFLSLPLSPPEQVSPPHRCFL